MSTERRQVKKVIQQVLPTLDDPSAGFLADKIIELFNTTRPLPTSTENEQIEDLVRELERGLLLNFPRNLKDQRVYKRLLNTGKPIGQFVKWVMADEQRVKFAFLYARNTEAIWRDFPRAFTETGHNPLNLEVGL